MKPRVVITGANGFIGLHTVKAFLQSDFRILAIDREIDKLTKLSDFKSLEILEESILSSNLQHHIEKDDRILHLAAISRFADAEEDPLKAIEINVEGTINLILAGIEKKANRIVFASTGSVYSRNVQIPIREDGDKKPTSCYGLSKKQAEDWIEHFSEELPFIILRYGYVYGSGKTWGAIGGWIENIKKGKRPIIFGGRQCNDFTFIRDIVYVNFQALRSDYLNEIYNIGTGKATSIKEACDTVLYVFKSDLKPEILLPRNIDIPMFIYDITKAQLLLGYNPLWDLRSGIESMKKEEMGGESR